MMRLFAVTVVAMLLYLPVFAQGIRVESDQEFSLKSQYTVDIKLYAGDKIKTQTAVTFVEGYPAQILTYTKRGREGVPGVEVVENLGGLILAGTTGCEFTKPDDFTDRLWDGFWLAAQHLTIGELEFYVYSPGADRIVISVDKISVLPSLTGNTQVDRRRDKAFYGSLEMPYHCQAIGTPKFVYTLKGFHDGDFRRELEFPYYSGNDIRISQLCRPKNEGAATERSFLSCFLLVVKKDITDSSLEDRIFTALDGYPAPPLNSVELGALTFYYYFPETNELEFAMWEIAEEYDAEWKAHSSFHGRKTVANDQPKPSTL